jgi:cell division protein ZapA (FtsZ GTPase activity inhibitor)
VAAGRVELSLLGQTLTVRTEASPEYVRQLAAYLEDRVAELSRGGIKDTLAALTLAALDITDELFRAREDKARQDGDVHTRLGALVEMLERLTPAPPSPAPPSPGA